MIHIVKLTRDNGDCFLTHTVPMEESENIGIKDVDSFCNQSCRDLLSLAAWQEARVDILASVPDTSYLQMEKFTAMLKDVTETHKFMYVNGRFHVDSYFRSRNIVFIAFLHFIKENKDKILTGGNILRSLYSTFRVEKTTSVYKSIQEHGAGNIDVFLYGPFPCGKGLYDEMLKICDEHGCSIENTEHRIPKNLFGGVFADKLLNKDTVAF